MYLYRKFYKSMGTGLDSVHLQEEKGADMSGEEVNGRDKLESTQKKLSGKMEKSQTELDRSNSNTDLSKDSVGGEKESVYKRYLSRLMKKNPNLANDQAIESEETRTQSNQRKKIVESSANVNVTTKEEVNDKYDKEINGESKAISQNGHKKEKLERTSFHSDSQERFDDLCQDKGTDNGSDSERQSIDEENLRVANIETEDPNESETCSIDNSSEDDDGDEDEIDDDDAEEVFTPWGELATSDGPLHNTHPKIVSIHTKSIAVKGEKEGKEEYKQILPSTASIDMSDPHQLFGTIYNSVKDTPAADNLLNILKKMLVIDNRSDAGVTRWQDIDRFTNQTAPVFYDEVKVAHVKRIRTESDENLVESADFALKNMIDKETQTTAVKRNLNELVSHLSKKYLEPEEEQMHNSKDQGRDMAQQNLLKKNDLQNDSSIRVTNYHNKEADVNSSLNLSISGPPDTKSTPSQKFPNTAATNEGNRRMGSQSPRSLRASFSDNQLPTINESATSPTSNEENWFDSVRNWPPKSKEAENPNIEAAIASMLASTRPVPPMTAWPPTSTETSNHHGTAEDLAVIKPLIEVPDWPPKCDSSENSDALCHEVIPPVRSWPAATTSEREELNTSSNSSQPIPLPTIKIVEWPPPSEDSDLPATSPVQDRPTSPLVQWPPPTFPAENDIASADSPTVDVPRSLVGQWPPDNDDAVFKNTPDDVESTTTSTYEDPGVSRTSSYSDIASVSSPPLSCEVLTPSTRTSTPPLSPSREGWHRQMLLNPPPTQGRSASAPAFELSTPGGIPPPPPPPPPNNFIDVPDLPLPDTPMQRSASLPANYHPQSKMKKLQWKKIPKHTLNRSNSCIWKKVSSMESVNLVDDKIEKLFAQPEVTKSKEKKEKKVATSKEISLLEPKTSMNVNIFLKQFKGGGEEVVNLIKAGKSNLLDGDRLRCLEKLLPDENAIKALKTFSGDKKKLGPAETFFMQLIKLPNYAFQITTLILKEDFESSMEKLKPSIATLKKAIEELLDNEILPEILSIILSVGNYLNHGSHAGNAYAFKITSLLKLTDTRANSNTRMTLLHYIVQMAEEKELRLLEFPEMMPSLDAACLQSVDQLDNEVQKLKKNLEGTVTQFDKSMKDMKDMKMQLGTFFTNAITECVGLERNIKEIRRLSKVLAEYLCEDPKRFVVEDNLKVFQNFCKALIKAREDNERVKQLEERKASMQQRRWSTRSDVVKEKLI